MKDEDKDFENFMKNQTIVLSFRIKIKDVKKLTNGGTILTEAKGMKFKLVRQIE